MKTLCASLALDGREAIKYLTKAQILLSSGTDQFRWPHALLLEHLLLRLGERKDAQAIFRLAAHALEKHPSVGSRRIMKHRVTNLLKAGDDEVAANLMFQYIERLWRRARDAAATLRDLELLEGHVSGKTAAEYAYWRAESLRHAGKLSEAKEQAEAARDAFERFGDSAKQAHVFRLLGHIASDMGSPIRGRELVAKSFEVFQRLGDIAGVAQAQVVLGEVDYLLGEHDKANAELFEASERCLSVGDALGRAQCLILKALIANAVGGYERSRRLLMDARQQFDSMGYRLGLAQCEVAIAHADHRGFDMPRARQRATAARKAFQELQNPRGEAACERLLAMIAIDTGDFGDAREHAERARTLFGALSDPWGELEVRILFAQIALAHSDDDIEEKIRALDEIKLDEAEPRQHRHLTRAWYFQKQKKWKEAGDELEKAHTVFGGMIRSGDHAPHLIARYHELDWEQPARGIIDDWLDELETQSQMPTSEVGVRETP